MAWKINKFNGTGVHIDVKKKTILHNPKRSWLRFETVDLIHIYLHEERGSSLGHESKQAKEEVSK